MEDKRLICIQLGGLLPLLNGCEDVVKVGYHAEEDERGRIVREYVYIARMSGRYETVNVTHDSGRTLIEDVLRRLG